MFIPKNHTEATVMSTINKVLDQLCAAFCFGYYDVDDMRSEGFIAAFEGLHKYNEDKSSLSTFLHHHIRNRFINLRRNKLERKTAPCVVCPRYNPDDGLNTCSAFDDQEKCSRWRGWLLRNQSKRNLVETSVYTDDDHIDNHNDCLDQLIQVEMLDILDEQMPLCLRVDYRRLIDGAALPKGRREKIYEVAREILEDYIDGET